MRIAGQNQAGLDRLNCPCLPLLWGIASVLRTGDRKGFSGRFKDVETVFKGVSLYAVVEYDSGNRAQVFSLVVV
jgi:hypothetical protein